MLKQILHRNKTGWWVIGLFFLVILSACRSKAPPPTVPTPEPFHIKRLLMIPFKDMARIYGVNVTVQCRLCGNIFTTGKVMDGADKFLTEHLEILLKNQKDLELIPVGQAEGALSTILSGENSELPERELLVKIGRSLDADAVLAGKVYRFIEREGTGYSVNSAASVAFEIVLIRASNGRIVWSGHIDETQQSLFEDLFQLKTFMKRGGRWITAEEMAVEGLNKVYQTFPAQ